jgi:hypothetical protein
MGSFPRGMEVSSLALSHDFPPACLPTCFHLLILLDLPAERGYRARCGLHLTC